MEPTGKRLLCMNTFLSLQDGFLPTMTWLLAATEIAEPSTLAGYLTSFYTIAMVALGLGFVIFVHELGHFLAAKTFGVKCEKFYVGFDVPISIGPIKLPAKLVHFQWGETEYGIGAIPLGGYVKMLGQDDDPRKAEQEAKRIREAGGDSVELTATGLDPRSYPAKPVYARMVIISAGVIMNLIFGAIFAAAAFMIGVPYNPSIVGSTLPGDPAWVNGLQPGDQFINVDNSRPETDELRFTDMTEAVVMHGIRSPEEPLSMVVLRDGERKEFNFVGTREHDERGKYMTIGVTSAMMAKIMGTSVFDRKIVYESKLPNSPVTLPDFNLDERIVAIDGQPLPNFPGQPAAGLFELQKLLDPKFDKPVTVTVAAANAEGKSGDAASSQTRDVTWQPVPRRTLGISMAVGPVKAIGKGTLAEEAKVGLGDRPTMLNGEPIEDGLTLHLAVAKLAGKTATLTLKRMANDGAENTDETYEFAWQVPEQFILSHIGYGREAVAGYELPGSGLVVSVLREVSRVEPDSLAEKSGLKAGDLVQQVQIMPADGELGEVYKKMFRGNGAFEEQTLDGFRNSVFLNEMIQELPVGSTVKLSYKRDAEINQCDVQVQFDKDWSASDRGVAFSPFSGTYVESNFGTALVLGVDEVKHRMLGVVDFLRMLATGKMNLRMMGGPGVIFYAASQEAAAGPTRLLLFLTMLSANLAVINFLPIPALDGGHMVFLAYEAIRGKPVDENLQMQLTLGGVLALLSLMVFVIINDVMNLSRLFS